MGKANEIEPNLLSVSSRPTIHGLLLEGAAFNLDEFL